GVIPHPVGDGGDLAADRTIGTRGLLEVRSDAAVRANPQEVIHVEAVGPLGFASSLGEERDDVGPASGSGRGQRAIPGLLEANLDGEARGPKAARDAEGRVLARTVQLKRLLAL